MSPASLTLFALAFVALGGGLLGAFLWRRASRARRALGVEIYERSLALDRRCDLLQAQVDALALGRRIDRLDHLLERAAGRGLLSAGAAGRLREHARELRTESLERPRT